MNSLKKYEVKQCIYCGRTEEELQKEGAESDEVINRCCLNCSNELALEVDDD